MIIYDILFILQFQVSTTVMDLVVVFALFVFMLALLCFCVQPFFSVNKDLYIKDYHNIADCKRKSTNASEHLQSPCH